MLATLGKIHYEQSIAISCQYWDLVIREFRQTLSNYNSYNLDPMQPHSQLVGQQMTVENLPSKNPTSKQFHYSFLSLFICIGETAITMWRQLLPGDILTVISSHRSANNSVSKAFCAQLLATIMIVLVAMHYIF